MCLIRWRRKLISVIHIPFVCYWMPSDKHKCSVIKNKKLVTCIIELVRANSCSLNIMVPSKFSATPVSGIWIFPNLNIIWFLRSYKHTSWKYTSNRNATDSQSIAINRKSPFVLSVRSIYFRTEQIVNALFQVFYYVLLELLRLQPELHQHNAT